MANKIKFKRGASSNLPALDVGEPALVTDAGSEKLYIGSSSGNIQLAREDELPSPATATPNMDGTASKGSSSKYALEDHVHPTDTSRAPVSHSHDASDIASGTLDSARLPTVPLTKGGTGQTTAARGLHALINGATVITAVNVADTDYIGLDDNSAATGKKMLVSELKKLVAPLSGTASCPAASSWSLNSTTGLYYVTVSLTGVLATHKLHLTPTIDTSDTATGEAQQEAWDTHYYAESVAGGVKFYAEEAPTVAVTFTWEAVL